MITLSAFIKSTFSRCRSLARPRKLIPTTGHRHSLGDINLAHHRHRQVLRRSSKLDVHRARSRTLHQIIFSKHHFYSTTTHSEPNPHLTPSPSHRPIPLPPISSFRLPSRSSSNPTSSKLEIRSNRVTDILPGTAGHRISGRFGMAQRSIWIFSPSRITFTSPFPPSSTLLRPSESPSKRTSYIKDLGKISVSRQIWKMLDVGYEGDSEQLKQQSGHHPLPAASPLSDSPYFQDFRALPIRPRYGRPSGQQFQ